MSTDYTPFDPPPRREPLLEHVRDLWTLCGVRPRSCTAAIYRNDFGLELRVEHGGQLIESLFAVR